MKQLLIIIVILIPTQLLGQPDTGNAGSLFNYQGTNVYYEEYGEGEPLLLLHTFYGTTRQWHDYLDRYADTFHVIAVDMFGHGKSEAFSTSKVFKHRDYAHAVLALMDHLGIEQANAIGASSGALTLLHANYLQPHRFKRVVEVGGFLYFGDEVRNWIREERADSANAVFMQHYTRLHGAEKAKLLTRQFWHLQFPTGETAFTPDMLKTFKASWLVVQGDNDFVGLYHAINMNEHIPESYLWIVPNEGHFPHLQPENVDDFFRRTMEFLTGKWN